MGRTKELLEDIHYQELEKKVEYMEYLKSINDENIIRDYPRAEGINSVD